MCVAVCTYFYWCSCAHLHVDICAIACVCVCSCLCIYACAFELVRMHRSITCYLTANTTHCIFGCLLPGRGELRECHIYSGHVADLRVLCMSVKQHSCLPLRLYARWILFCVFVRERREMARQFQLVKYCGQEEHKG